MTDDRPTLALIVSGPAGDGGSTGLGPELQRTLLSAADRSTGNEWDEIVVTGAPGLLRLPLPAARIAPNPRSATNWTETDADFMVFAPAGLVLASDATNHLRELIRHNPSVELAYFDSIGFRAEDPDDLIEPCHRPGFSPDRLRTQMYLGEMLLVCRRTAEAFDPDGRMLTASMDHSTVGRLAESCRTVAHLPQVLYRSPVVEPETEHLVFEHRALAGHQQWLRDQGFPATAVTRPGSPAIIHLEPRLTETPKVSIIIPTNGAERSIEGTQTVLCLQAVDSIIAKTSYIDFELVVVTTPGSPADLANQVLATIESRTGARRPTVRFCHDDRAFNFSNACNRGAVMAAGDVLVFLNDDTVVGAGNWLDRLVMYATRPDVGAVGGRLLYGDGSIQHAGIWTRGGHPAHRYEHFPADHSGYLDSLLVPQNCLAVTGACLGVQADKFREVGGFSPEFPSSYNDVDLCLKLDDVGYRTVIDPAVVLTHYEASSRDPKIDDWELSLLHERWRSVIVDDPYDNPHHLAPAPEEYPPPDAVITEQKRLAGWVDFPPRLWPRPVLTAEAAS